MRLYPAFINLSDARVLVVGGGAVGKRKIASLVRSGVSELLILDIAGPDAAIREFCAHPGVVFECRGASEADVRGRLMVFAATGDAAENARIAKMCAAQGVLCNVATDPVLSTFHVPSSVRAGGVTAAFSTGGASPALAGKIKVEAGLWLERRFGPLAVLMGRLRPHVLALGLDSADNTAMFRRIVASSLADALISGDREAAEDILRATLPGELHNHVGELLHDLC